MFALFYHEYAFRDIFYLWYVYCVLYMYIFSIIWRFGNKQIIINNNNWISRPPGEGTSLQTQARVASVYNNRR